MLFIFFIIYYFVEKEIKIFERGSDLIKIVIGKEFEFRFFKFLFRIVFVVFLLFWRLYIN